MARVTIRVDGDYLGNVEIEDDPHVYYPMDSYKQADLIRETIIAAAEKALRHYPEPGQEKGRLTWDSSTGS